MIPVVLALLAAIANAAASNLQRLAARTVPDSKAFRFALVVALIRHPVWLGGIAALIAGFVFQAAALSQGPLALVQPVLITELPFTMLFLSTRLETRVWLAMGVMAVGLTIFLLSAAPGPGHDTPDSLAWIIATIVTVGTIVVLCVASQLVRGAGRAAVLGVATGFGFAFTAAFMKEAAVILERDAAALPTSWQLYAMVAAGLGSLFLLQNTLQSGTLVAAQPALTISDPVASILYGALLYGEGIRTGAWVVLEVVGIGGIFCGSLLLARSPQVRAQLTGEPTWSGPGA